MRTIISLTILLGFTLFSRASELQEGAVWYWQDGGNGQRTKLEVRLDDKTILTTTFAVVQTRRATIPKRSYAKKIRFSFKPQRSIVWSGYRDEDIVSPAKKRVECEIWMAGADESGLILGACFDKPSAILMNALHLALSTREAHCEIAEGLTIVTTPVAEKSPKR